ncbi:hypothetical protein GW17_00042696 [Ensete ventricosum]|uniref:Uncharacterized protein n=1 Tax=Ensete ventricosum TaxID=4639 RepID=A0A444D977_ENSVE|nr:hypothetical protein GW17_00042696 [Ensete ventricosum]RZR74315.1 hypothetical protein BHM03_00035341 [Ensete ventricosum]
MWSGTTPSFIASQPTLLNYSLQKRVIPRFRVTEMLKLKGLWTGQGKLLYILQLSDTRIHGEVCSPSQRKCS